MSNFVTFRVKKTGAKRMFPVHSLDENGVRRVAFDEGFYEWTKEVQAYTYGEVESDISCKIWKPDLDMFEGGYTCFVYNGWEPYRG